MLLGLDQMWIPWDAQLRLAPEYHKRSADFPIRNADVVPRVHHSSNIRGNSVHVCWVGNSGGARALRTSVAHVEYLAIGRRGEDPDLEVCVCFVHAPPGVYEAFAACPETWADGQTLSSGTSQFGTSHQFCPKGRIKMREFSLF